MKATYSPVLFFSTRLKSGKKRGIIVFLWDRPGAMIPRKNVFYRGLSPRVLGYIQMFFYNLQALTEIPQLPAVRSEHNPCK